MSEQSAMWIDRGSQRRTIGLCKAYSVALAKIDSLAKKAEGLSTSTSHLVNMVQALLICNTYETNHLSSSYPSMTNGFASTEQVACAQNFQCQGYNP